VRLYKGGIKNDFSYCLYRETLIYITNMIGVNVTVPTEIAIENGIVLSPTNLNSTVNNMTLLVGATEFKEGAMRIVVNGVIIGLFIITLL